MAKTLTRQFNVRVDAETEAIIEQLLPVVSAALGVPVRGAHLVRLGIAALARQYLPPAAGKDSGKKSKNTP